MTTHKVSEDARVAMFEEQEGRVVRLVLTAPPDNALDLTMVDSLRNAVDMIGKDLRVGAVLIQGAGRDFSSGHPRMQLRPPFAVPLIETFHAAAKALLSLDTLLISVVRGRCEGAAAALAFLGDFVLADNTARFQFVDASSSLPPLLTVLVAERLERGKAAAALLADKVLKGEQAAALGLVTDFYDGGWDTATIAEAHLRQYALTTPSIVMTDVVRAVRARLLAQLAAQLPSLEQRTFDRIGHRDEDEVTAPTRWRPG